MLRSVQRNRFGSWLVVRLQFGFVVAVRIRSCSSVSWLQSDFTVRFRSRFTAGEEINKLGRGLDEGQVENKWKTENPIPKWNILHFSIQADRFRS